MTGWCGVLGIRVGLVWWRVGLADNFPGEMLGTWPLTCLVMERARVKGLAAKRSEGSKKGMGTSLESRDELV